MRDLEIRGAGNLLGSDQSGHIAAVGYDLYVQMVAEAVAELKGEEVREPAEIKLDLPVDANLPADYVEREDLRLEAYRRLADGAHPRRGRRHPQRVARPLRSAARTGGGPARASAASGPSASGPACARSPPSLGRPARAGPARTGEVVVRISPIRLRASVVGAAHPPAPPGDCQRRGRSAHRAAQSGPGPPTGSPCCWPAGPSRPGNSGSGHPDARRRRGRGGPAGFGPRRTLRSENREATPPHSGLPRRAVVPRLGLSGWNVRFSPYAAVVNGSEPSQQQTNRRPASITAIAGYSCTIVGGRGPRSSVPARAPTRPA